MHSIGTDIVELSRIEHWPGDPDMLSFVFTESERETARRMQHAHKFLAAAFAIKESFLKAIGTGWGEGLQWKDIEISKDKNGWAVRLHNKAGELCGAKKIFVTASCSRDFAVGMVVIENCRGGSRTAPTP